MVFGEVIHLESALSNFVSIRVDSLTTEVAQQGVWAAKCAKKLLPTRLMRQRSSCDMTVINLKGLR